jgi:hypothetical protein
MMVRASPHDCTGRVGSTHVGDVGGAHAQTLSYALSLFYLCGPLTHPTLSHSISIHFVPLISERVAVCSVGALCVAHALADLGDINLLAVMHNTGLREGAGAIAVINQYYHRPHIRIGAYRGPEGDPAESPLGHPPFAHQGKGVFVHDLVSHGFPAARGIKDFRGAEQALDVYRSELAQAADGSVVIAAVGHLTNILPLLQSKPDAASPLSGVQLVQRKVKQIVIMGGRRKFVAGTNIEWNLGGCGTTDFDRVHFQLCGE